MPIYDFKKQPIEKEIAEYSNYNFDKFSNLNIEEKLYEYHKISRILLFYENSKKTRMRIIAKSTGRNKKIRIKSINKLEELIDILKCVIHKMDLNLLK